MKGLSSGVAHRDRRFEKESGGGVDAARRAAGAVKCFKVEGQRVLGPTAELVARAIVGMRGFDCGKVGEPMELVAPRALAESAGGPPAGGGFADKGVEMTFFLVTTARDEFDGAQSRAFESKIECAVAASF